MNFYNWRNEPIRCEYDYAYDSIVQETAKFIKEMGIKGDLHSYYYLFCYLLYNGYISVDHKFKYDIPTIEDIRLLGANIIGGKGICRNIATFMKDVFTTEELNYKCNIVTTHREKIPHNNAEKLDHRYILQANYDAVCELERITKTYYDHCELHIKDDIYEYLFDPTNLAVSKFFISYKNKLKGIVNIDSIKKLNIITDKDFSKIKFLSNFKKIKYIHNEKEYDFNKKNVLFECDHHQDLLDDFHNEVVKHISI